MIRPTQQSLNVAISTKEINEMVQFHTKYKTSVSQGNRGFVEALIVE